MRNLNRQSMSPSRKRLLTCASLAVLSLAPVAGIPQALAVPTAAAQTATQNIKGIVTEQNGEPVIGATVRIKGTNKAAVTDLDGGFTINAPTGSTIEITYVGMLTKTFVVKAGTDVYNVTMTENANDLDQVVVVGYGHQKKVNLSGSVASVNVDKISESRPVTNISQALAGAAAGINVRAGSNQPGSDNATILIRGVGTLNSSGPLIIIDGVEAPINSVSPQDIESMSVLKDAASASIYGSRAANGVILITTKKGKSGKVKVNYSGYVSFESIKKSLTPVSNYADYMELINEGYENSGLSSVFSDEIISEWRNGTDPLKYPNTDWIDATFKNGVATNHNVAVSGGTDKIRIYSSFGYNYNEGVMPNSAYERFSARVSAEADITKWLTIGAYANGYRGKMDRGASQQENIFKYASATTPGMVFQAPDGRFGGVNNPEDDVQAAVNNPLRRAYSEDGNTITNQANIRLSGTVRPYKGIELQANYSFQNRNQETRTKPVFNPSWNFMTDQIQNANVSKTYVSYSNPRVERYFWDAVARYNNTFWDKFDLGVMIGMSSEKYHSRSNTSRRNDLVDLSLWALNGATGDMSVSGATTEWAMQSYFGRINLSWDSKYLLELNIRRDGSSRFLKGKRWGTFPSASAAWRLDQENFMESLTDRALSNLKLRVSYGSLGNNSIENYEAQSLYLPGYNYSFGDQLATGIAIDALANPNVTWESTRVFNFGVDFGLWQDRFTGTVEFFNKKTKNILISLPAPDVHGIAYVPTQNAAEVSNRGVELTLNWNDRVGDFQYNANFNFTYVHNNVDKFKGKGEDGKSISGANLVWEGYPINCQYLLKVDRIIQTEEDMAIVNNMIENAPLDSKGNKRNPFAAYGTPEYGDFLYKDMNGDGIINDDDRVIVSDGPNPKFLLGLNLGASWKGLDFSMLLQSQLGAKRYWQSAQFNTPTVRKGYQINKEVAEGRWYEGRTDATYPRLLEYQDQINTQRSDFYLQNLAYLKIRNIQLGYTLPQKWTKAIALDKVRFYCNLENFFTFTSFKGFDPEVYGMSYPTMRQVSLGLNVSF